jgi:hypothetical protein
VIMSLDKIGRLHGGGRGEVWTCSSGRVSNGSSWCA